METGATYCKHLFLDIVGYSKNRTVEAQSEIITKLNEIVKKVLSLYKISTSKCLLLPTGDGICITFLNNPQFDFSITFAVKLLEEIKQLNEQTQDIMRKFEIRIGINENIDNIIIDINNRKNVAGPGINYAQRIMSLADGNMILIGSSVYEQVNKRDKYYGKFKTWHSIIKHGEKLFVYQYIDKQIPVLNINTPSAFEVHNVERKEINKTKHLLMYLALVHNAVSIYGQLIKSVHDPDYIIVMLFYLSDYINDYLRNSKNIIKGFSGNFLGAITNEGRTILITKAMEEIHKTVTNGLMISDLSDYIVSKFIVHNNAEDLFIKSEKPIQLSESGLQFVEENCKEQLEFIQEIK